MASHQSSGKRIATFSIDQVVSLWLERQGLLTVGNLTDPGRAKITKRAFQKHLRQTGGLQVDTVNVVDRAHFLTLWSRFGKFDRRKIDQWIYRDKIAYEYWGHEASILPIDHLPLGKRRMKQFPPANWKAASWWSRYDTPATSKRRVMARLKKHGALESSDFEKTDADHKQHELLGWGAPLLKEDKRSLQLLWHAGKVAVADRRHFRKVFDLADRHYPESETASTQAYHDSWLLTGLRGCGIASEGQLVNYMTAPSLKVAERASVIARNLKRETIVEVRVPGHRQKYYGLTEHLDCLEGLPAATGTTLICPFDSLLWQRKRAEELLNFRYRVEIYVPEKKREFGYYVLPILHEGKLVGRLDPKLHREKSGKNGHRLEIKKVHLEPEFKRSKRFDRALAEVIQSLAEFLEADRIEAPRDWSVLGS